eukprot:77444-Prorocentrum_minimum.AAC.1
MPRYRTTQLHTCRDTSSALSTAVDGKSILFCATSTTVLLRLPLLDPFSLFPLLLLLTPQRPPSEHALRVYLPWLPQLLKASLIPSSPATQPQPVVVRLLPA